MLRITNIIGDRKRLETYVKLSLPNKTVFVPCVFFFLFQNTFNKYFKTKRNLHHEQNLYFYNFLQPEKKGPARVSPVFGVDVGREQEGPDRNEQPEIWSLIVLQMPSRSSK